MWKKKGILFREGNNRRICVQSFFDRSGNDPSNGCTCRTWPGVCTANTSTDGWKNTICVTWNRHYATIGAGSQTLAELHSRMAMSEWCHFIWERSLESSIHITWQSMKNQNFDDSTRMVQSYATIGLQETLKSRHQSDFSETCGTNLGFPANDTGNVRRFHSSVFLIRGLAGGWALEGRHGCHCFQSGDHVFGWLEWFVASLLHQFVKVVLIKAHAQRQFKLPTQLFWPLFQLLKQF